jgi:beta-galactosidase
MNLFCLGQNKAELAKLFPGKFKMMKAVTVPSLVKKFKGPLTGISNAELHLRTATMAIDAFKGVTETSNEEIRSFTIGKGTVVLCQAAPWMFDHDGLKGYLRTTYRRNVFLVSRLLHNLQAPSSSKLIELWNTPGKVTLLDLGDGWKGMSDLECRGDKEEWWKPGFADTTWKSVVVPGRNTEKFPELADKPGTFWYKLKFKVPAAMSRDNPTLYVGGIDDESWVWLNGAFLGEMSKKTNPGHYWDCPRTYDLKPGILNYGGGNTLVVKVNNLFLKAGMLSKPKITADGPWTKSYYLQKLDPEDDPYRYFRW